MAEGGGGGSAARPEDVTGGVTLLTTNSVPPRVLAELCTWVDRVLAKVAALLEVSGAPVRGSWVIAISTCRTTAPVCMRRLDGLATARPMASPSFSDAPRRRPLAQLVIEVQRACTADVREAQVVIVSKLDALMPQEEGTAQNMSGTVRAVEAQIESIAEVVYAAIEVWRPLHAVDKPARIVDGSHMMLHEDDPAPNCASHIAHASPGHGGDEEGADVGIGGGGEDIVQVLAVRGPQSAQSVPHEHAL